MPKLQETKGRYFITIPNGMVQRKKWKKAQELFFTWNERGNIEIHEYLCTHCNRQHDPRTVKGHAHVIYAEGQPPIGLY
jgi:hypothetical protein